VIYGLLNLTKRWAASRFFFPISTLLITALGALFRFGNLANPQLLVFDETYYVKDAYTLGLFGHEKQWPDNANPEFEAGNVAGYLQDGAYVVHPPVGKWVIWFGIQLFGADSSFGWRFSVALLGTLAIPLIIAAARLLIGNRVFAALAGLFLAVEGQSIVLSRTSILDGILAFFVLLAFYFLLLDRQKISQALNRAALAKRDFTLSFRPWLWAMALALGLASGVKWSGLYFLAIFGIYTFVADWITRQRLELKLLPAVLQAALNALVLLVISAATYLASWSGWLLSSDGWGRQANENWLVALWNYHTNAYGFHTGLSAEHPYAANAWQWLLSIRPTAFYYESFSDERCGLIETCSIAITPIPHPLIWYSAVAAMIWVGYRFIRKADLMAGAVFMAFLAGWAPWLAYLSRTTFQFYAVVFTPFLILALAYALHSFWRNGFLLRRVLEREWAIALFVLVALALAAFFASIWMGLPVPYWYWRIQMWLPSWI
jgi:dolichyl-phosphate-mannose--protein O-mannosyl transferase